MRKVVSNKYTARRKKTVSAKDKQKYKNNIKFWSVIETAKRGGSAFFQ
jgi:hypothetical protein